MSINANFRFSSVGQGLFYTGIITKVHNKTLSRFVTIYDCGSSSKKEFLHTAIDEFEDILPNDNKVINLLTISHFDEDHVNGLPMLLNKFKVNTVIIPYISIYEKLLHISIAPSVSPESSSLLSLYRDPIQFFTDYGVKNIIMISGDEQIDEMDSGVNIVQGSLNLDEIDSKNVSEEVKTTNIMLAFYSLNLVSKEFEWKFEYFNREQSKDIKNALGKIVSTINDDPQKSLTDKKIIREIRNQYKMTDSNVNDTSIVLMHYPTKEGLLNIPYDLFFNPFNFYLNSRTLLTGDINFKKYQKELLKWIGTSKCDVISVPHHGAEENWDKKLLDLGQCHMSAFVVSYGISNKYGHPSFEVKSDVLSECCCLMEVTQRRDFIYTVTLK